MKPWIFILSLLIQTTVYGEEAVLMSEAIEGLLKESLRAPAPACPASGKNSIESFFSPDRSQFDRAAVCKNAKNACIPVTLGAVCEQVRGESWKHYQGDVTEQNPKLRRARLKSNELRKKIFTHTQKSFNEFRDNPALQDRCCPKDLLKTDEARNKCVSFFKKTQLYLLKGLPEDDLEANYQGFINEPVIEISEARLLYCKTPECIEDTLLHELGHACQYSRGNLEELFRCQAPQKILEKDLTLFFGKETARCVLKDLKTEFKDYKKTLKKGDEKPCLNRWVHEAFADMIFMDLRKLPTAFYQICNMGDEIDDSHGPYYVTDCVLNQAPYRESLCGPEPECERSQRKN